MSNEFPPENVPHDLPQFQPGQDVNPESTQAWFAQGVVEHVRGNSAGAEAIRTVLAAELNNTDPRKPGVQSTAAFAARTIVNTLDAYEEQVARARRAYGASVSTLKSAIEYSAEQTVTRAEIPATQMHYAVMLGGLAVRKEYMGEPNAAQELTTAQEHMAVAWRGSADINNDYTGLVHQTRINMARRRAAMLGLTGSPIRGISAAMRAVMLSPLSESPRFARNSTFELTRTDRLRAKTKAFVGGLAAGAVSAANLPGVRKMGGRNASLKMFVAMEGVSWLLDAEVSTSEAPEAALDQSTKTAETE